MDATASREPTWDTAIHIQSEMFSETDALGGLDVQLAWYRGFGEFRASPWVSDSKALVERIERLEEEKKALADDIREVYGEAKANGFDTKALRAVVRMRGQEPAERQEFEAIVELYRDALGIGG